MSSKSKNHRSPCLQLAQFIGVGSEKLGALDVVPDVNLLVLRVSSIVRGTHRQQNHCAIRKYVYILEFDKK